MVAPGYGQGQDANADFGGRTFSSQVAEHLSCPWCQYDLFGLPTERGTVRCSECGNRARVALLRISPEARRRKLRGMEALPRFCTLLFWCTSWVAVPAVYSRRGELLLIAAFLTVSWMAAAWAYLRRYECVTGAREALVLFHACMTIDGVGLFSLFMGGCALIVGLRGTPWLSAPRGVALVVIGGMALLGSFLLHKRARRRLKDMCIQLAAKV
jgi:hypothetical protein